MARLGTYLEHGNRQGRLQVPGVDYNYQACGIAELSTSVSMNRNPNTASGDTLEVNLYAEMRRSCVLEVLHSSRILQSPPQFRH
mmetsp:Transcript_17452/g.41859  ORF Transcript_17452/g.41859 Transcript_17452/m.41859 type:complete len:84 (-) Transcript_17452:613-864(-)